jgi:hypothetical protein
MYLFIQFRFIEEEVIGRADPPVLKRPEDFPIDLLLNGASECAS